MRIRRVSSPGVVPSMVVAGVLLGALVAVAVAQVCGPAGCPTGGCPTGWSGQINMPRRSTLVLPPNQGAVVQDRGIFGNRVTVPPASSPRPFVCEVWIAPNRTPASGVLVYAGADYALVATCRHVVAQAVYAVQFAGRQSRQILEVLTDKFGYDLALVRIRNLPVGPVVFGPAPQVGDCLTICGFPRGRYGEHSGRVVGFCVPEPGQAFGDVQIGVASQDGDSGGAVLDSQGRLAGILWGTRPGESVAVSVEAVAAFVGRARRRVEEESGEPEGDSPIFPSGKSGQSPDPSPESPDPSLRATVEAHAAMLVEIKPLVPVIRDNTERIAQLETRLAAAEAELAAMKDRPLPPLRVRKVDMTTGEETIEEVRLGDDLLTFRLFPPE